ncbi:MAG: hypothetical protein ACOZF0_21365 [Thermodesulfobacteriota bacterium]
MNTITARNLMLAGMIWTLGFSGMAEADIFLKYKLHTDGFQMMGQTQPAKDANQETWITDNMVRTDEAGKSTILRLDQKRVYFIDHQKKTYTDMPLGVEKMAEQAVMQDESMSAEEKQQAMQFMQGMMKGMAKIQVTVTETGERKKIGKWNCTKYLQKMTTAMGPSDSEIWATRDIKINTDLLNKMQAAGMMMMPGMQDSISEVVKEMKKINGVSVLSTSTAVMMNTRVKTTHELVDYMEKKAPSDWYALPKGYGKEQM